MFRFSLEQLGGFVLNFLIIDSKQQLAREDRDLEMRNITRFYLSSISNHPHFGFVS